MRAMLRIPVILVALLFGATGSQLPEFVQQYSQRLGGAVDELTGFVAQFDEDARAAGLSRNAALKEYTARNSEFLGRRGDTVAETIQRYERLKTQKADLDGASPVGRVVKFIINPQSDIAGRAWEDFKPAMPLTFEGGVFALLGVLLSLIAMKGGRRGARAVRHRLRPAAETPPEDQPAGSGHAGR